MPLTRIEAVQHGSTSLLITGSGSYSSRSTVLGGSAVMAAPQNLKLVLRRYAAEKFGSDAASVEPIDGTAQVMRRRVR